MITKSIANKMAINVSKESPGKAFFVLGAKGDPEYKVVPAGELIESPYTIQALFIGGKHYNLTLYKYKRAYADQFVGDADR